MRNTNLRKQSDVVKIETYNSLKNQLEQQNAALLRERANIQQQSRQQQVNTPMTQNPQQIPRQQTGLSPVHSHNSKMQSLQSPTTINLLRSKLSEIINLCQNQSGLDQFIEIAEAQKQILLYLDSMQPQKTKNNSFHETPYEQGSKKKKSRMNKTEVYQNNRQSFMNYFSDQALEMIQEIQRKALLQIQALRIDKINLMKRLNQEIKAHNQEKRLRNILDNKFRIISEHARKSQIGGKFMEIVAEENQDSYRNDNPEQYQSLPQQSRGKIQKVHTKKRSNFHPENIQQSQIQPQHPSQPRPKSQRISNPSPLLYPPHEQTGQFNQFASGGHQFPRTPVDPSRNINNEIGREVQKFNRQNLKIKEALSTVSYHNHSQNPNLKLQLRTQLGELQGKIRFYQREISQRQRSSPDAGVSQLQNLIIQAHNITEDGNKLLNNTKSSGNPLPYNSEKRPSSNSYEPQQSLRYRTSLNDLQNTKKLQYRATLDYERPPLQTFSPIDKSYHSQTYKGGFSPTKYENLIEEMNRATYNRG